MCGIAGAAGGAPVETSVIEAMCAVLHHRGPDEGGTWASAGVALGMRRLSIVDVAHGHQPMVSPDGRLAVVFNGEIYNSPELRSELQRRGHQFRTHADTEVLLHLYEECGERLVERLRGMFAFALWDSTERRLVLARDRVGKKPLYYRVEGERLWFGSEVKAILQDPGFVPQVDEVALHHYLTLQYVPAPWSIFEGVSKLPPAHFLVWEKGRARVERYWRLSYSPELKGASDQAVVSELRDRLVEATRLRLLSERPIGAFLSGGVDSSLVVACMAELSSAPIETFTIGFEEHAFDERSHARAVAERFSTAHHELVVSPSALEALPQLVWHFDEPFADSSAIPSFALASLASEHVVVALNGDGADESFGGYRRYALDRVARRTAWARWPLERGVRAARHLPFAGVAELATKGTRWLDAGDTSPERRYARWMCHFDERAKEALYSPEFRRRMVGIDSYELLVAPILGSDGGDAVDRLMDADVQTYLPGDLLVKMDRATMAHSLEARSPFLDHELMEFAASLPPRFKVRGRTGKWALKQLARGWLPDEVIDRRKQGFGVPMAAWLRGELRDLAHDLLTDAVATGRGWFEPASVISLLDEHAAGLDHSTRIWNLLVFEAWHRRFIDARGADGTSASAAVL